MSEWNYTQNREKRRINENIERITIKYAVNGKLLPSFSFSAVVRCSPQVLSRFAKIVVNWNDFEFDDSHLSNRRKKKVIVFKHQLFLYL